MSAPTICYQGVTKRFRGRGGETVTALAGFALEVAAGAVTCLLGATGCGKTTALRLAAGLDRPDAGRVTGGGGEDGAPPASAAAGADGAGRAAVRIGFVPQEPTLFPWLRLEDNVAFPLRLRGTGRRERRRRAGELLDRVGLGGRERAYPHECSGGMRQRAMLARLLADGARLWLLDEPFAALDERTRHRLQDLLLSLRAERGLTVLFVTHNIDEAVYLADRVAVLTPEPGRVAAVRAVDLPHPRDRLSDTFATLAEAVRRDLERAVEAPPASPEPSS